jgi:hypothetical protein
MTLEIARQLWTFGGAHSHGAEAVVVRAYEWATEIGANDPEEAVFNGQYSAPIYLLLGYGFELLLKSAFVAHGGDTNQLGNRGIGHDLTSALQAAEQQGFRSDAPNLHEIINLLHEPHLAHQFRYGGMDNFPLPANLKEVVSRLHDLAAELQELLYPRGR